MHTFGRFAGVLAGVTVVTLVMSACSSDTAPNGTVKETGGVWVANNNGMSISEFTVAQLDSTSTPTPADTIGGLPNTAGIAVDAAGDVWASSYNSDTLWMFTLAQQTGGGAPTPTVKISSASLPDAENMTFDANGTLWVADDEAGLVGFTSSQLASSGAVTAAYTITNAAANNGYWAIIFDKQGNAWAAAATRGGEIDEYTPTQLTASGAVTPHTVITTSASNGYLYGIAFDGAGNLWAVFDSLVAEIPAASLATGGTITPAVTITLPDSAEGFGAAFDKHGTLWVSDAEQHGGGYWMYGYKSSQLTSSGAPTPAVVLGGAGFNGPEQMTFDAMAPATTPAAGRVARPLSTVRAERVYNPNAHRNQN
jgi:ligand-binding sensor domain-containing protein